MFLIYFFFFFFKQKTAYEMRISDWSSDVCSSDLSALRLVEGVAPDLLLLDIAMPRLDGMEVARAVGKSNFNPAVIFVTAFEGFAVEAFDLAAMDYLLKPVSFERLVRAIDRSEEHTSELQSLMRISYAVFCLKKKKNITKTHTTAHSHTTLTRASKHSYKRTIHTL